MKCPRPIGSALIVIFLLAASSASAQNLLTNPGFESGLAGWNVWSAPPSFFWNGTWLHQNDCDIWTPAGPCPYAGTLSHSQEKGSGSGNAHGGLYQVLPVTAGRQYRVSGIWSGGVRAQLAGNGTWWEITAYDGAVSDATIDAAPGPSDTVIAKIETSNLPAGGVQQFDWQPFSGIFTAPSGTVTLALKTGSFYTFEAAAYHDDLVVELLDQPLVGARKTAAHLIDVDSDGLVEPGDTLRYTVVIENPVDGDGLEVLGAAFLDTPDPNTTLVAGSVTTTVGTVTTGNTAGDGSVAVDLGTIADGGVVTITFDVLIAASLPPGVTSVANQGTLSGSNVLDTPTDDPAQPGATDTTVTSIELTPVVTATKLAALLDGDGDGFADSGEAIRYTIVLSNVGIGPATDVTFADTPDANSALVVGSVTTTTGSVTSGNLAGDAAVAVNVGTLAPASSATIVFDVTIDEGLPREVQTISNQGVVAGSNIADVPTDDPATAAASDPTVVSPLNPESIPLAGDFALLMLATLLAAVAFARIRS